MNYQHTNALIDETSPYLLQHAHNPVNWYPWGEEALEKAQEENKLLLISVGYSACHWCHVMERESFEDTAVAKIMNEHFVSIKVDREERPDIDQVYMTAVQLMTQQGGWPLNCFALPDGRPIYGGTYFRKEQWMKVLSTLAQGYENEPEKYEDYAQKLTAGIQQSELVQVNKKEGDFTMEMLDTMVLNWSKSFDHQEGGTNRAPKFPLPNNYEFLLQYANLKKDQKLTDFVKLTLDKMAMGGIYDHVGGGFARYSTDVKWKVPHFEKMLYDNAQLISLYSKAYQLTKSPLYKKVILESVEWTEREMMSMEGGFYAALDADSEGEEGKFYIWSKPELKEILGDDFEIAKDYFNVNTKGYWEHENYILLKDEDDSDFAEKHGLSIEAMDNEIKSIKERLLIERAKRVRPGLDDKILTSWNGLMIKGLSDAYLATNESASPADRRSFLDMAIKNANFILTKMRREDGGLWHSYKNGKSKINGYLEDYCFVIEGLIALYQATFEEKWLNEAKALTDYTINHFYDSKSGMFFFTSDLDEQLIVRKMEINDNVIPASNSTMAKNLFLLGKYFDNEDYLKKSKQMLKNVESNMSGYGPGYSNWASTMLYHVKPFYEIAITGTGAEKKLLELNQNYIPNRLFVGAKRESTLPLLKGKYQANETMIYVCVNKACQLPTSDVNIAKTLIEYCQYHFLR